MFSDELRALTHEAVKKRESAVSESFILFVKERSIMLARTGSLSFKLPSSSLPWGEAEMTASFPHLKELGLEVELVRIKNSGLQTMGGYSIYTPQELRVNWIHNE